MKKCFFLYLWILISPLSFSQIFKGIVSNENGETIPYASLYIKEISYGFITDDSGNFHTSIKQGTYTCEISSLGYSREVITIHIPAGGLTKNIVLKERVYELREVSITTDNEDPAYSVMRKAIAHAPKYRNYVQTYTADTYLKGTGKLSRIPALLKLSPEIREESKEWMNRTFLLEEHRRVTYTAPSTWDNEIKAYTNSFPQNIRISLETTDINLYQPKLFGKISPLNPGAFSYYDFKLDGCFNEGDYLVNKIQVIPKKNSPELLSGHIYIIEDLWCVSTTDLHLSDQGITANIQVTCKEVEPSVFLSTSIKLTCIVDFLGVKAEASYLSAIQYIDVVVDENIFTAPYAKTDVSNNAIIKPVLNKEQQKLLDKIEELQSKENFTTRDAYKMSKLISKSIQRGDTAKRKYKYEIKSRVYNAQTDSLATERDSAYWAGVRTVPLRPEEVESYARKEIMSGKKDSTGRDSVKSVPREIFRTILYGNVFQSKDKKGWLRFYNLSHYLPEFNFVDGLWIGTKLNTGIDFNENTTLQFIPQVYYAASRKSWMWNGELNLYYAPRRLGKLSVAGGNQTADFNGETGESRLVNSFSSLLFARNDIKLYDRKYVTVKNQVELVNSLKLTTGISWEERRSLENAINRSIFQSIARTNIPNNPHYQFVPSGNLLATEIALEYTPEHYYRMFRGTKYYENSQYPTIEVKYGKAFSYGGSEKLTASFQRFEFSLKQEVEFGFLNTLNWYINGGLFWDKDNLYFADFKHFSATKLPVTKHTFDRTFSLLDNYKYSTDDRWVQAYVMWRTPYLLIKRLPFLQDKYFDEALHFRTLLVPHRKPYAEVGYSVGFAAVGRVGIFAGFEKWRYKSVGVSITFPFLKYREY